MPKQGFTKLRLSRALLFFQAWLGLSASNAPTPTVLSSLKELAVSPDGSMDPAATLAFVSDSRLAILACDRIHGHSPCRLSVVDYREESLRRVFFVNVTPGARKRLFALDNGHLMLSDLWGRSVTIFSPDLKGSTNLRVIAVPPFPLSKVIGDYGPETWKLYRLSGLRTDLIREGHGELESASDKVVVFRDGDRMHAESLDGQNSSAMPVPPKSKCGTMRAELAGADRLYVDGCGDGGAVRDVHWGLMRSIAEPPGWGVRHGWTSDGGRILFDHYTRTVSFLQHALEIGATLATLGLGAPNQDANGERIQVIDTRTGGVCFDWDSTLRLLGSAGEYHADISPSGQLVAAVAWGKLMIYRLPRRCH